MAWVSVQVLSGLAEGPIPGLTVIRSLCCTTDYPQGAHHLGVNYTVQLYNWTVQMYSNPHWLLLGCPQSRRELHCTTVQLNCTNVQSSTLIPPQGAHHWGKSSSRVCPGSHSDCPQGRIEAGRSLGNKEPKVYQEALANSRHKNVLLNRRSILPTIYFITCFLTL